MWEADCHDSFEVSQHSLTNSTQSSTPDLLSYTRRSFFIPLKKGKLSRMSKQVGREEIRGNYNGKT